MHGNGDVDCKVIGIELVIVGVGGCGGGILLLYMFDTPLTQCDPRLRFSNTTPSGIVMDKSLIT